MTASLPIVATGYSDVPPGHLATVVTYLEMRARPELGDTALPQGITLQRLVDPDLAAYRALYEKIGTDWLWFSRVLMEDGELRSILLSPTVEIYEVRDGVEAIGLVELDFREPRECELTFFGLVSTATGRGLGRAIIKRAIELAWTHPIDRFWLHTCTLDSPAALGFYRRSGFVPYALRIEVEPDPRLSGHLPLTAAPHVPVIEAQAEAQ